MRYPNMTANEKLLSRLAGETVWHTNTAAGPRWVIDREREGRGTVILGRTIAEAKEAITRLADRLEL